ncbi:dTDP-4-dehydrorhamnose reductase [Bacillus sp. WOD8 KX774193]|uniref:dTDP-4-dehydrorhamnose reductase n=1 Tax=Bacillus sp. WOD8 KX774193 TaxID=3096776 RepID=UPI002DBEFA12|nr:dTDP-4-dehydrorhamnose reductase [Bacillus sp. WOD8 KX774193]MEC3856828.1 dTDP-4-dehydrorhamnose reductase [Bacillus sp. WOD8 KX774193]
MKQPRVLVTGAKGQLGKDMVNSLTSVGYQVYGFGRDELNITDSCRVKQVISEIQPAIVIHTAAHTKVDLAESEPEEAFLINGIGTRNLAVYSESIGAKMVYISTDYVFDGTGTVPYNEFTSTSPLGVYGRSKLAGEHFVQNFHSKFFIVRTSWVYGQHGNNFVKTMLEIAKDRDELSVVNDQRGCPTYTIDLASYILQLIDSEKYGVYHISNSGQCTWYEFAKAIFEEAGIEIQVNPCTTNDFPRPAPRPAYSVFDHMSLRLNGFNTPRGWRDALKEFLNVTYLNDTK